VNPSEDPSAPWLLADVGGTNVRFALCQPGAAAPLQMDSIVRLRGQDFASLEEAAAAYLAERRQAVRHAVLAVAGRIEAGAVQLTNSRWHIASAQLQQALRLESVQLVNDFAAVAMALPLLGPQDLVMLAGQAPSMAGPAPGFCALGAGTGLGVAALRLQDGRPMVLQTEGGHTGFAPGSDIELAILAQLTQRFGRVSNERLVCGAGLVNIYQALCAITGQPAQDLAPAQVSAHALAGDDALCAQAVDVFCGIFGSVAGDCALAYAAWDGVFLAGAWLQALLPRLQAGLFHPRFVAKGRFEAALRAVPVALITHPQPGLLGAAGFARAAAGHGLPQPGRTAAG
jgi:glucokinase